MEKVDLLNTDVIDLTNTSGIDGETTSPMKRVLSMHKGQILPKIDTESLKKAVSVEQAKSDEAKEELNNSSSEKTSGKEVSDDKVFGVIPKPLAYTVGALLLGVGAYFLYKKVKSKVA